MFGAGTRGLKELSGLSLADLLLANRLPPSLFQAYESTQGAELVPIPITTVLEDVPAGRSVVLRCIRNTDVSSAWSADFEIDQRDALPVAALFDVQFGRPAVINRAHLLNAESLRDLVSTRAAATLRQHGVGVPLVAGISGGGDSNTLVSGVRRHIQDAELDARQVMFFTLVLDPIWPETAAARAGLLVNGTNMRHRVLRPHDIAELLHMKGSPDTLLRTFTSRYGDDTSHFFATFLIALVGRRLCEELESPYFCLGYNREDVLAELLFCLINGRRPLQFPVRRLGNVCAVFPVWDLPKYVLDGCYPEFSRANYAERDDSTTVQRSAVYFLAHSVDALVPQISVSLMSGVSALMDDLDGWQALVPLDGTALLTTGLGDKRVEDDVLELLGSFFPEL